MLRTGWAVVRRTVLLSLSSRSMVMVWSEEAPVKHVLELDM
jgi:hypothetical protein